MARNSRTIEGDDSATATYDSCDDGRIAITGSVDEFHRIGHPAPSAR